MASEDVIELGSSDDDNEPAPKKMKTRPNAMVHIPTKLPGLTIKPTKIDAKKPNPFKKLIGKSVTVTKVKPSPNPNNILRKPIVDRRLPPQKPIPIPVPTNVMNPISIMKKLNSTQVQINRIPKATSTPIKHPITAMKQGIRLANVKSLSCVSSNLSVTKLPGPLISNVVSIKPNKRKKTSAKRKEVATVELDDEEIPATSTATPAWYLRPEESIAGIEQKNNSEREPTKMIEITIEDSPVKPPVSKRTHEVGAELAITIDDSPVKSCANATPPGSDNEHSNKNTKVPHSKKKLNYPRVTENVIEIELEPIFPIEHDESATNDNMIEKKVEVPIIKDVVEVLESPAKNEKSEPITPEKINKEPSTSTVAQSINNTSESEFHTVYHEFIDLCLKLENSNDMKTIVEKKIKGYYRQVPKEYTESEDFIDMVQSKILAMKAGPDKLYLHIKDVVDELNLQRKMAKAYQAQVKESRIIEAEKFQYGEESEFDAKRQRQIRKLEKTLRKLHRAIQKLEEQEVDFDDDEDSVYLLTERYKERMVRVHAKFCQLTNTKMPSEPHIHIDPRPGQPPGPAKRLEKWVNKKVPIGKPRPFPDFHDVLRCVREANEEDKLGWNEADIMEEARDLFTRSGKKLQRRRQENEWRLAASRLSQEGDPAETSEDLKRKLESNRQLGHKKEADVFNKFADKQNQLQLEAVEIGDKEAEESPIETEDDDVVEEGTSKEKRKKRLRRLIQEKSKKNAEEKELEVNEAEEKENDENLNLDKAKLDLDKAKLDLDIGKKCVEEKGIPDEHNLEKEKEVESTKANENRVEELTEGVHSISDDSQVDSDVDELHLLQKLHSDEMNSSAVESSDSDSPIDISDTIESSSEKGKPSSDVISIENSSYSESETKEETKNIRQSDPYEETKCLASAKNPTDKNDNQCDEIADSVLLASSDEDTSPNLKDDDISIEKSVIKNFDTNKQDSEEIITDVLDACLKENNTNTSPFLISKTNSKPIEIEVSKTSPNFEIRADDQESQSKEKQDETSSDKIVKSGKEFENHKKQNVIDTLLNGDQVGKNDSNSAEDAFQKSYDVEEPNKPSNDLIEHKSSENEEPMETDKSASIEESVSITVGSDKDNAVPKNVTEVDFTAKTDKNIDSLDTILEEIKSDLGMNEPMEVVASLSTNDAPEK